MFSCLKLSIYFSGKFEILPILLRLCAYGNLSFSANTELFKFFSNSIIHHFLRIVNVNYDFLTGFKVDFYSTWTDGRMDEADKPISSGKGKRKIMLKIGLNIGQNPNFDYQKAHFTRWRNFDCAQPTAYFR